LKEMVRSVQNPGHFHVLVRMAWISLYRIGHLDQNESEFWYRMWSFA